MPPGIQQQIKIQTPQEGFLGLDTASDPTSISLSRSRRLYNAFQGRLRALTKRPGSVPVIGAALPNPIKHLTIYPFGTAHLLASSGTSLYKYDAGALTPVTMTNNLNRADIFDADYTGVNAGDLVNVKVIADGGILKQYDGTEVKDVTPAADDPSPQPANVLSNINSLGVKFVWEHNAYVFATPGDNKLFYSKQAMQAGSDLQYNYFPETHFTILVRKGDYINGVGIPFDNVCFIPMRKGWCVLQGTNYNDFNFSEFLNTINGLIAPRSPQIITYANGQQTIAFLSDDGVHEIFTTVLDNRGKQYATRGIMKDKIDFDAIGFTESEKAAAISKYIVEYNMYLLEIDRDGVPYVFGYDTRNGEWYVWTGLQINALIEFGESVFFAGNDGLLKRFDKELYSDWHDKDKTTGTPVDFDRISGMVAFEETGYPSTLDYYILKTATYSGITASLDVSLVHLRGTVEVEEAVRMNYLIWAVTKWDSKWANLHFSDLVGSPKRLSTRLQLPKKFFYMQVRLRNNRDEPCEIFSETFIGRDSGAI